MHRLTGIDYPSDSSLNVRLAYDADGRLTKMTDASGVTAYAYDVMGRTTDVAWTPKGADQAVHLAYAYDAAGRLASLTYPSGRVVSYHYGADGRIQDMDATVDGRNQTLVSNIAYSPLGGVASRTLGNGIVETRSYDDRGRLTAIDAGSILQRTLNWSPQSTITAIANGVKPAASQSFAYDATDRLTSATGLYGNLAYTYDANGNRMSKADAKGIAAYSYQANTNRLTAAGSITYARDAAGNRLSDGTFTYTYGANNRLASVAKQDDDHGRQDVLASYVYNGSGQRAMKRLGREGEQATWYVYDLSGNLIAEMNHRGRVTAEYVYGPTGRLATIAVRGEDGKSREERRRHEGDDSSESVYWHINDHLGTPQALTDRRGRVVWAADYMPFGSIVKPRHGDEDRRDHGEGQHWKVTNNFRFPGQYYDAETRLNYNYHRTYDPAIGRYTQVDPSGLNGGMNSYGYVQDNPLSNIDLFGLAVIHGVPCGSVKYTLSNGLTFYAPPTADFPVEWLAGNINGMSNFTGILQALGQGGTYDYQRKGGNIYLAYVNAANFGVGVFMEGAGYSKAAMDIIGRIYADIFSSNAGSSSHVTWWHYGWEAAKNDNFPKASKM